MVNIVHRIGIRAPVHQVFQAIATTKGLASWWTEQVEGSEQVGDRITFRFLSLQGKEIGKMVMEVQELTTDESIMWRCTEGPAEWIGTDITFRLTQEEDQTIIIFGHRNWREEVDFTAHCSMKWAVFLLSLREYVETGKGKPSPHDLKIDNWN
jgi:uncharacterized protein YndB with AHSA1/START domain